MHPCQSVSYVLIKIRAVGGDDLLIPKEGILSGTVEITCVIVMTVGVNYHTHMI